MNYALDSPISRKIYVPEENEIPFAPISYPPLQSAQDQSHRQMSWLFHKPQDHAIFPVAPKSGKIVGKVPEKKK
jgi:hypothetical protein